MLEQEVADTLRLGLGILAERPADRLADEELLLVRPAQAVVKERFVIGFGRDEAGKDRSQLAVYHLMFGPGWDAPCPGCTQWANALNGTTAAFARADARLVAVSRAPIEEITRQRERLGWHFTWVSAFTSEFNYDFYASAPEGAESAVIGGADGEVVHFERGENHGVSVFFKDDAGQLFHTYSAYNRGIEELNGAFGYFDLLPGGRGW